MRSVNWLPYRLGLAYRVVSRPVWPWWRLAASFVPLTRLSALVLLLSMQLATRKAGTHG
jgi:hypothetical protein